jgi:HlyD family secretion protein
MDGISMAMDVKRDPKILKRKKIRQAAILGVVAIAVVVISVAVSRLKPAAPSVPEGTLWFGTVKRGPMVREVRGAGTLVPEDIRWIPALAAGRVEKIVLRPGATVKPGTVILELSNPDLKQAANDAELAWKAAEAQLENLKSTLSTTRLRLLNDVTDAQSAHNVAQSDLEANAQLEKQGIVASLQVKQKQAVVDREKNRWELAKKSLESADATIKSQLAPQEATVSQQKARYDQLQRQLADLKVKSDMDGRLQALAPNVEHGAQVALNSNLVRVSDPTRLKAEVRISETQTRDLAIGQQAKIDTRNGWVKGHVTRIDPSSVGGTVGVDVTLDEPLPAGARPDQSIDGVIELQRLENILYVESPAFGQENSSIQLFKVLPTREAVRTTVKLGVRSVQFVEVLEGLQVGDRVVLSDMSQYDSFDRVRLN